MLKQTSHKTLNDISGKAHWARCSSILWTCHRGFTVCSSPLLSNLRDMPWWYSQVRNRRCRKQGAPISPPRPKK